jgi:hypothetical protein
MFRTAALLICMTFLLTACPHPFWPFHAPPGQVKKAVGGHPGHGDHDDDHGHGGKGKGKHKD